MSEEFQKALSNFTHDVASGGAIRHLADLDYTVEEIYRRLDFPTSKEQIGRTIWEYYLQKGILRLDQPPEDSETQAQQIEKVTYVVDHGKYGTTSLRRVVTKTEIPPAKYYPCDFGKELYKDKKKFQKKLEQLEQNDRDYIMGLPWPLQTVYHRENERMKRIMSRLQTERTEEEW